MMSDQIYKLKNNYLLPLATIWGRHFIKETLKVFVLFIVCFYGLYVLIDFSSHSTSFHHNHMSFKLGTLIFYYGCEFIKRAEVIVPFALMIATIRVLCKLNMNNEWIALLASGVKLRSLLRPFLFLGILFSIMMYINTEYLMPQGLKAIKHIDAASSREKNKANERPAVQHVLLEDETPLLFHDYDSTQARFIDAYWFRSLDDVYHMKYLYPYGDKPLAEYIDHWVREPSGYLVLKSSDAMKIIPDMRFNNQKLLDTLIQPQELSLQELNQKRSSFLHAPSEKEAQVLTVFYYKLVLPWLCLLAIIGPAPFCIKVTRQLPVFFIYAASVFGLVAFYLIMDAALVLGSRQVLPPLVAILTPFISIFGFFFCRYVYKTR
jgi:lipopolysaccharide export system permease protein